MEEKTLQETLDETSPQELKEREIRAHAQESYITDHIVRPSGLDDTKETRQCGICKKSFKSGEFVKKHLLAKHSEIIKVVETKAVLSELVRADYLKDPSAKIPTIVPAKNRALRGMESAGAPVKPEEYADKSRLVEYGRCGAGWLALANTYRDRDAVNGIKVQARKTISDVFDDF